MGLFDKRSNLEKLQAKQVRLTERVELEFEKAKDFLSVAGFDTENALFALRAQVASLSSITRSTWVVQSDRIIKVSGLPPAYSRETFLFQEIDGISVSTEMVPTVAFRSNGRYITFKADSVPAQYFCDLVSELLSRK
jgi:hypothetical protein